MTKKKKGQAYDSVSPALLKQVKNVIAEGDRHRYSVSQVYAAYNAATGKNDTPQTCSSCLRNRVRELRKWLSEYEAHLAKQNEPQSVEIMMADGLPIVIFTPSADDPNRGTVKFADNTTLKAGTYKTAEGFDLAVQPGGKATLKEEDLT